MSFLNPFNGQNKREEKLIKEQNQFSRDSEVLGNASHPQDIEYQEFLNKENMMAELTKWQQDLSPMLQDLFTNLCGLTPNEEGTLISIPNYPPLCNSYGARRFVDTVKPLDKNVMNGTWSIKQINDMMIALDDCNTQDIIEHWEHYEIEYSIAAMDRINETIINAVYPTYLRGLNNGERTFHGKIQKTIETKNMLPEKRKGGLFGKE